MQLNCQQKGHDAIRLQLDPCLACGLTCLRSWNGAISSHTGYSYFLYDRYQGLAVAISGIS
jgi:hypothetical protein